MGHLLIKCIKWANYKILEQNILLKKKYKATYNYLQTNDYRIIISHFKSYLIFTQINSKTIS